MSAAVGNVKHLDRDVSHRVKRARTSPGGPSGAVVVLVEVAGVLGVPVPVVDVVDVVAVLHGFVPAALAVDVLVLGRVVMLVIGGRTHLATALSSARTSCHRRDLRSIGSATRKAWVPLNGLEASSAEGRATGFRQRRLGHGGGPYVEHCRRRASRQTAAALGLAPPSAWSGSNNHPRPQNSLGLIAQFGVRHVSATKVSQQSGILLVGCLELQRDSVRVAEVEVRAKFHVLDWAVGDVHRLEPLLPRDQLVPTGRGQPKVIETGLQLGVRSGRGAGVLDEADAETGCSIQADPTVAEVEDGNQPEHLGVETGAAVQVGNAQGEVVDSGECGHRVHFLGAQGPVRTRMALNASRTLVGRSEGCSTHVTAPG